MADGINQSLAVPHFKSKRLNFNQCRVGRHGKPLTKTLASELISICLFLLANPTKSQLQGKQANMRATRLEGFLHGNVLERYEDGDDSTH